MSDTILRVENLSRYFRVGGFRDAGTLHATDEVTFEVASSEIVALVGSNGAGKTTLLRAISRRSSTL